MKGRIWIHILVLILFFLHNIDIIVTLIFWILILDRKVAKKAIFGKKKIRRNFPFSAILRLKKEKKKKVPMATKLRGGRGGVRP